MVSRIIISIALLCSSVAFSQDENGLTFSQVLIVDITNEVIVPDGKVWKVVSVLHTSSYSNYARVININGGSVQLINALNSETPYALPLWLPSGTSISIGSYLYRLNIIEFNTD